MSDPLTALMHAVQVMNLLKTLILKTLRDREETSTEEYSSMSSHSSDRQSEVDDYDSQQEMDTSGEFKRAKLDYDDHADYSHNIEEAAASNYNAESVISVTDTKTEDSCLSSSSRDDSTTTEGSNDETTSSPSIESKETNDVEMVNKCGDSVSSS